MKIDIITKQVVNLAKAVGLIIKSESKKFKASDIESKGIHNLVTYVDKQAEKTFVQELGLILPEAGFIAEEDSTLKTKKKYNWVIDPLDGTTNFIHGLPPYAISIALLDGEEPILGVIYEINLDECFYAWKGGPSYLNDREIHVSKTTVLNNSLIATGFPYYDYDKLPQYMELLSDLMKSTRGIRRLGSAATDLAYVACGRFDTFYEYGLNSWDIAAGILIVKQAGGTITDFKGGNNFLFGQEIIASNTETHKEMVEKIAAYFKH